MRTIHVGVMGLGNVGAGALQIIRENRSSIELRIGAEVNIRRVLVRDRARPRQISVDPELLTEDPRAILDDPSIQVVVELIGGIEPARTYVLQALSAGKHVVSANKALLAAHGGEIFSEAARRGLSVYFEGSIAGGIPIVRSLREGLASDRIEGICGVVNGTSNYVLDAMTRMNLSYADAVAQAQRLGFAEADPSLDVNGTDSAHKLALLALVSFGLRVDSSKIPREGIEGVRSIDIAAAQELGYVIKSLAIAELDEQGLPCLRVHPTLVPRDHILAGVHGCFNAVMVQSRALGSSLYYGQGAGMLPTGVAVVSDIIEVCRDIVAERNLDVHSGITERVRNTLLASIDSLECENYLCFHVPNQPGVLGQVASCLGRLGVSIRSMRQTSPDLGKHMNMWIVTEKVAESQVKAALVDLQNNCHFEEAPSRIRILPENGASDRG